MYPLYSNHPYNQTGTCPCGDVSQYMDVSKIVTAYEKAADIQAFIDALNQISDEKIWFDAAESTIYMAKNAGGNPKSDTLIGRACHCKYYNHATQHHPTHYCTCCAEFCRPMFAPIFGTSFDLTMTKTVLAGHDECLTAVKIHDLKKFKELTT